MTTQQFTGRVALITGASQGIGAATARLFAQAGAAVVLASRSEEELAHNVEEIRASGGEALDRCGRCRLGREPRQTHRRGLRQARCRRQQCWYWWRQHAAGGGERGPV